MPTYLRWQDYPPLSQPRIVANLMGTLSRRWYPVNIIGSTIYDMFNTYGNELFSASVEEYQVFSDLFINTARTTSVLSRSTSKLYDNFGSMVGVDKQTLQDFTYYTAGVNVTQSYRQQLRLLYAALLAGTSYVGLEKTGQSYSGMAPIFAPLTTVNAGWVLTTYTGSVVAVGSGFIQTDRYIPRIGTILPTTGQVFNVGDPYVVSWSKLGTNTKLIGAQDLYSGIRIWAYMSPTASVQNGTFRASFEAAVLHDIRADMNPVFYYPGSGSVGPSGSPYTFPYMAYYRPDFGTSGATGSIIVDSVFLISPFGYLVNYAETLKKGSTFTGSVVTLPSTYQDRDWYYDWDVRVRNDARYRMAVRSYNSYSIPSTIYFQDYSPFQPVQLLPWSGSLQGAHYVFDNTTTMWDISGNKVNLLKVSGSPTLGIDRTGVGVGVQSADTVLYTSPVPGNGNVTGKGLTIEMWVKGFNTSTSANGTNITLKYSTDGTPGNPTLGATGYVFSIDLSNKRLSFGLYSGSLQQVNTAANSIASYMSETIPYWHYFVGTYVSGSMYLYLDGNLIGSGSSAPSLLGTASGVLSFAMNHSGAGDAILIDELFVSNQYMPSASVGERFCATKPRLRRLGQSSGSVLQYHQPQLTVWASGSNEAEFHEFSLRGLQTQGWYMFNVNQSELFWVPLFKSGSV